MQFDVVMLDLGAVGKGAQKLLYVCVYDQVCLGGIFEVYISKLKTTFVPKVEGRSTRTRRTYEETR